MKRPFPGLMGDYSGSCVVCLTATDTGLSLAGEAEYVIAGLIHLGVPKSQAGDTYCAYWGLPAGQVRDGMNLVHVRVCESCAAEAGNGVRVGLLASGEIPFYGQPDYPSDDDGGQS